MRNKNASLIANLNLHDIQIRFSKQITTRLSFLIWNCAPP